MMMALTDDAGKFRRGGVGVFRRKIGTHGSSCRSRSYFDR